MCQTCDGHLEAGVVVDEIDGSNTSTQSNNPCPEGWKCEEDGGNKYCVDTYMPNRNAYIINDEICFPPFYGVHGSSLRGSIDDDDPSQSGVTATQCAANIGSNHIYKKNGSPMLPHLFQELFGAGDPELRASYVQYMQELEANPHESEMYFNKEAKSGRIYELLERYFNMDAIDYCKNIFTDNTVLINPTMPGQDDEANSYYYPGWIQLKRNILESVTAGGGSGAQSIFNYLNGESEDVLPTLDDGGDQPVVRNWDHQMCMMYRGVDNDQNCTLPVDSGNMTEEICNQITDYHWDTTDPVAPKCKDLQSNDLNDESLQRYLSTVDHTKCAEMNGTYITEQSAEAQFQLKKNNRLIPVYNERYCSICRSDGETCTTVGCGLNSDTSACNPDGTCNCYGEDMSYGPTCRVDPALATQRNTASGSIGNKIVHPDNSYSYSGRTTSTSELPVGYNLVCKGDYLDPDRVDKDNTRNNENYVGKYCDSTVNEVCHSRKPIFSSENYSEELRFLNILDMDEFVEKVIAAADDKYIFWPFYQEGGDQGLAINNHNKIMLITPDSNILVSPSIESYSELTMRPARQPGDTCDLTCMDHPFNHARLMHTIALFLFDPYLTKNHYTKTEQIDGQPEVAPEWGHNSIGLSIEEKLKNTNDNFENLPVQNKMKYYAMAIKMASQFARVDQSYMDGTYTPLQILLYRLAQTLQTKNGDHKMNFYNAYFKEWSSTTTGRVGNDSMVNCDCTRPSRETNSNIYTFIKNYNPGDANQISRWGIKPPGTNPLDNEHLYYYGDTCENYDAKGLAWTSPDPIASSSTAQDVNMRCNIESSESSWNIIHDQPRQMNDVYSYQESDGTSKIEDGSAPNGGPINNSFKNPKDYYDGSELSFLTDTPPIDPSAPVSPCVDPVSGEVTALCGDRTSIKNEYDHQQASTGNLWAGLYPAQTSDDLISHLPDFDTMPEINLIERLRISKAGAKCDCSYSQSRDSDSNVKETSKWGEFCQYKAGDVCNPAHMSTDSPGPPHFRSDQLLGSGPDDYFEGKRKKQINKEGDYPGLIYSHHYFDGRTGLGESDTDYFSTEQQSDTGRSGITFSVGGGSVEIGTPGLNDWYQGKINSKIPVIKNPKFKEVQGTNVDCSSGGAECNESLYSLCKCDAGNMESRFTSGAVMSDNPISCNIVADNCEYPVCQHSSTHPSTSGFGGYNGVLNTATGDGTWDCDSNPAGFDVSIHSSQSPGDRGDLTDTTDVRNVCFCDDTHYQVGSTPNCTGSCCPEGEVACGWRRDPITGKNCVEDLAYGHGVSQLEDGALAAHGRKSKMNAHAVYNHSLNKSDNKSHYDYDPLCDDNCYHTDTYAAIHAYLNEEDPDWATGTDRDHAVPNDDLVVGPGGGLSREVNFDDDFMQPWDDIGPLVESGSRTLTDDFYTWLPSHSVSIIGNTDSVSNDIHADYKCVPNGGFLGPWAERARTGNVWMDYWDGDFDGAIEEVFETNKEKYLFGRFKNQTNVDGTLYFDATEWDDDKSAKAQTYGTNIGAYDCGTTSCSTAANIAASNRGLLREAGKAPESGRNPMWLLAKGCCTDVLKIDRRSNNGVNEVRVSCGELP